MRTRETVIDVYFDSIDDVLTNCHKNLNIDGWAENVDRGAVEDSLNELSDLILELEAEVQLLIYFPEGGYNA